MIVYSRQARALLLQFLLFVCGRCRCFLELLPSSLDVYSYVWVTPQRVLVGIVAPATPSTFYDFCVDFGTIPRVASASVVYRFPKYFLSYSIFMTYIHIHFKTEGPTNVVRSNRGVVIIESREGPSSEYLYSFLNSHKQKPNVIGMRLGRPTHRGR